MEEPLTVEEKAARWDAHCVRMALTRLSLYVPEPAHPELNTRERTVEAIIAALPRLHRADLETLMVVADLFADAHPESVRAVVGA